jgi:putative tricarboxylic transport membrane protein
MVLALVLGDAAESSFRQAMLMSQGSLSIMWENWLVGGMTTLALFLLFWPFLQSGMALLKARLSRDEGG